MVVNSILHFNRENYIGRTKFGSRILHDAVSIAVNEVAGVIKSARQSIKILDIEDEGLVINLGLQIDASHTVAEISYKIQESVINAVKQLIEKRVSSVNLTITGVAQTGGKNGKNAK